GELDFACLAKNSVVETRKGRKYVVDVTEYDEVFTPFGWQRVSTVHKYRIKSKVFRLTLEDGKTLTCTARHKFPVLIKDSFKERRKKGERALSISISQKAIVNDFLSKYNSFIANHYLTLDEKASFLRGFFEGDGGVNTRRNTIQCNQSFVNTEKLEIVCNYLRELNIKNRVGTY